MHKHYDVIVALAQGKAIECCLPPLSNWAAPNSEMINPLSYPDWQWRIKPETILINNIEVPKPLSEAPKVGTEIWQVFITGTSVLGWQSRWSHSAHNVMLLSRGLLHSTQEEAETHARALLSFTAQEIQ